MAEDSDDCDPEAIETASVKRTVRVWPNGRVDDGETATTKSGAYFMEPISKKASGRLLDGREWNEIPEVRG